MPDQNSDRFVSPETGLQQKRYYGGCYPGLDLMPLHASFYLPVICFTGTGGARGQNVKNGF